MVCPNCQLTDIQEDAKMCPRCGEVLTNRPNFSQREVDLIKEKAILKGNIAEYQVREKQYKSKISQLRTYVVLLILIFPISRFLCNKQPRLTYSDYATGTLNNFASEQYKLVTFATKELLIDEPTFLYITQYGDNPESLSRAFYKTRVYADTILADNYINNDRRIPTGDTLLLRKNPKERLFNAFEIRALQKHELRQGNDESLRTIEDGVK